MSITIKINPSSKELSCTHSWIFDNGDPGLNTFLPFDIDTDIDIPMINIILKNNYEYTLIDTTKSLEFTTIKNQNYYYTKIFNLNINYVSSNIIHKNNKEKIRYIIKLSYIYSICVYSYFIYNKYYSMYNNNKKFYINMFTDIDTINEKKLFNCRNLYKIYSFI
jgi:hypothetical protein